MKPFLTAEWRHLAMLNWAIAPDLLSPLVPAGTELDAFHGTTYVSVVGLLFVDTRLLGIPIPFHRRFEEVNLRFYVRRIVDGDERRGVVFVRELVPRSAIARVARIVYNEPYSALAMSHDIAVTADAGGAVAYRWRRAGRREQLTLRATGRAVPAPDGSLEAFITEHYWGYTRQRDGGTIEYRVDHPRWNVWTSADARLDADVTTLYGSRFADTLRGTPASAFLADGSPVTVYRPIRLVMRSRNGLRADQHDQPRM